MEKPTILSAEDELVLRDLMVRYGSRTVIRAMADIAQRASDSNKERYGEKDYNTIHWNLLAINLKQASNYHRGK